MQTESPSAEPKQVVALDGSCTLSREDIGGKAWGVNRMRALGLPVPPAIVADYPRVPRVPRNRRRGLNDALWAQIVEHMKMLEEGTGRRFGGAQRPLLVSVRSGAAQSMPGMMDTVLNLGINAAVEAALAAETGDARYAADTHHRFVQQYRKVVLGDRPDPVPADPWAQLRAAVAAVFDSWHSPRAQVYRRNRGLSDEGCTAVTIQAMVFGNLDERSGHRRAVQPQPDHRRRSGMGRMADTRSGRGRGVRSPHAPAAGRAARADAGGARRVDAGHGDARSRRARHPGHRVHRRVGTAMAVAVAGGQALAAGGPARGRRLCGGRTDLQGRGGAQTRCRAGAAVAHAPARATGGRPTAARGRRGRMPGGGQRRGRHRPGAGRSAGSAWRRT